MNKYEVQIFTLCDDWLNTWHFVARDGKEELETFDSYADAEAALDEFLAHIEEEITAGQRNPNHGYSRDEFRIAEIRPRKKGV